MGLTCRTVSRSFCTDGVQLAGGEVTKPSTAATAMIQTGLIVVRASTSVPTMTSAACHGVSVDRGASRSPVTTRDVHRMPFTMPPHAPSRVPALPRRDQSGDWNGKDRRCTGSRQQAGPFVRMRSASFRARAARSPRAGRYGTRSVLSSSLASTQVAGPRELPHA